MSNLLLQMDQTERKSIWNQAAEQYMLYEDPILTEIKIPEAKHTKLYFLRFFCILLVSKYTNSTVLQIALAVFSIEGYMKSSGH